MKNLYSTFFLSIFIMAMTALAFTGCKTSKQDSKNYIPYTIAKNYFAIPDVNKTTYYTITTEKEFNELFGMATTMGKDGRPTDIDFSKQFVVAIICPTTDYATDFEDIKLVKSGSNERINFSYKKVVGTEKRSYSIRPMIITIIDKKYNAPIDFTEIQ